VSSTLYTGIGELVTCEPALGDGSPLGLVYDAALVVHDGRVAWVGAAGQAPAADDRVDLDGRCMLPGFVDSHAHLVFAGHRDREFAARMQGQRYAAGGIRTTVAATRAASDEDLRANVRRLVSEARAQGTATVEVKSGYGLSVDHEVRALRLAAEVTQDVTFLGAHVVPAEFEADPDAYVELVAGPMMDACAPLARWVDVFVEQGAFDRDAARHILSAGAAHGLGLRVHANQLRHGPGVQLACELGAASADHCTHVDDADIAALEASGTVATLLPGAEFSTRSAYPDARRLLDAGVTVALATDCNPGTSFTSSMPFCIALAVRDCGMTPSEAVWAATAGGAAALQRTDAGRMAVGAPADLTVLDAPNHTFLAYRPGVPLASPLPSS
jgi:imidazolonepropionase